MTGPVFRQQPEGLSARVIWLIGAAIVVASAALVAIAWLLVVPPPAAERPLTAPSPLEHRLFDQAAAGDQVRAAGEQRLQRTQWIDRRARTVRIPIDRAIDLLLQGVFS